MDNNLLWTTDAYHKCLDKVTKISTQINSGFPHVCLNGKYNCESSHFWTSGFWGGLLWLTYRETNDASLKAIACGIEKKLNAPLHDFYDIHHDVGFMYLPTAVTHYKETGNEESRRSGLIAASHLAGRFNFKGEFIRAWNHEIDPLSTGWAIIDCLMNLPLLFWASKEINDPRFRHIAIAHLNTILKSAVRPDSTVPHIVSFDPETGEKIENLGGQGLGPDSAWSRGQAWGIYGFAIAYRETGDEAYITAAKNLANYFISHLPADQVPYWDFRTKEEDKFVKDASAAACTASGLLEISQLLKCDSEKAFYHQAALTILKGLYQGYCDFSDTQEAILTNGTVSYPNNHDVNVPIIYGDFFFVEALAKLHGKKGIF